MQISNVPSDSISIESYPGFVELCGADSAVPRLTAQIQRPCFSCSSPIGRRSRFGPKNEHFMLVLSSSLSSKSVLLVSALVKSDGANRTQYTNES